jgi:hypothetical protein
VDANPIKGIALVLAASALWGVILFLITYIPVTVMFLPRLLGY